MDGWEHNQPCMVVSCLTTTAIVGLVFFFFFFFNKKKYFKDIIIFLHLFKTEMLKEVSNLKCI
jgi:hypothetical protein